MIKELLNKSKLSKIYNWDIEDKGDNYSYYINVYKVAEKDFYRIFKAIFAIDCKFNKDDFLCELTAVPRSKAKKIQINGINIEKEKLPFCFKMFDLNPCKTLNKESVVKYDHCQNIEENENNELERDLAEAA